MKALNASEVARVVGAGVSDLITASVVVTALPSEKVITEILISSREELYAKLQSHAANKSA